MANGLALVWFLLGFLATGTAAVGVMLSGWNEPDPEKGHYFVLSTGASATMAVAYFLLLVGLGSTAVGDGSASHHWARWVGWLIAGPLYLWAVAKLVNAPEEERRVLAALGVVAAIGGLLGGFVGNETLSLFFWALAGAGALGIVGVLFVRLNRTANERHPAVAGTFGALRLLLVLAIAGGVLVEFAGPVGLGVVPGVLVVPLIALLDVAGAAGAGFYLCRSRAVLDWAKVESSTDSEDEPIPTEAEGVPATPGGPEAASDDTD